MISSNGLILFLYIIPFNKRTPFVFFFNRNKYFGSVFQCPFNLVAFLHFHHGATTMENLKISPLSDSFVFFFQYFLDYQLSEVNLTRTMSNESDKKGQWMKPDIEKLPFSTKMTRQRRIFSTRELVTSSRKQKDKKRYATSPRLETEDTR